MEFGAFFILVLVVIAAVVLGGGVMLIAARFRAKQLDPDATEPAGEERPKHTVVESDQDTDFVGTR
jgi:hypothetical protein